MAINLGHLRRSPTDKHVAGVAGGIAHFFDIDPVVVRVAFVVLAFFGGAGLILYLGVWIFTPMEDDPRVPFSMDVRSRALALYIVIGLAVVVLLGTTFGNLHAPWFVWVIAAGALLLLWRERQWRRVPYVRMRRGWVEDEPAAPVAEDVAPEPVAEPEPPVTPPADGGTATYVAPPRATTSVTFESFPLPQPKPRRPGPILFWFTLAVIALAEGVLGTIDVAGAHVIGPAYAATAVGITAVMLVVGAFWGRPGGLILVGLVASFCLLVSTTLHEAGWDGQADDIRIAPTSTAALQPSYAMTTGELKIDLRGLTDMPSLDGHSLDLDGHIGHIEVLLPAGVGADVVAEVHGPGHVQVGDDDHGGIDTTVDTTLPATSGYPTIHITADLSVGEIEIHRG